MSSTQTEVEDKVFVNEDGQVTTTATINDAASHLMENIQAAFTTPEPTTAEKVGAKVEEVKDTVVEGATNVATYGTTAPTVGQKISHELDKASDDLHRATTN